MSLKSAQVARVVGPAGGERRHPRLTYERIHWRAPKRVPVLLEVVSENDRWLRGYQVNSEGERIAPRTKDLPKADERLHIIEKSAIAHRQPLTMNLKYGELE